MPLNGLLSTLMLYIHVARVTPNDTCDFVFVFY